MEMASCGSKPEAEKKPKLMMVDDAQYEIDSDEDASPSDVVLYDRNSPNHHHHHHPLGPLLTDYAKLSIHVFNTRELDAHMKCNFVELVRASSSVCNGLFLKLEVAAKNPYFGEDAETHTFYSKIWYKGTKASLSDADVLEVIPSASLTLEQHFKSQQTR